MSTPANPIFIENKLDRSAKKLKLVLNIPVITYPDGVVFLTDNELAAYADREIESWAEQVNDALVDEPVREFAWRAITFLALQNAEILRWEAQKKDEGMKVRFFEEVSHLYVDALEIILDENERARELYLHREIDVDEVSMRALGVHDSDRKKDVKGKGVERKSGLDDIPEE